MGKIRSQAPYKRIRLHVKISVITALSVLTGEEYVPGFEYIVVPGKNGKKPRVAVFSLDRFFSFFSDEKILDFMRACEHIAGFQKDTPLNPWQMWNYFQNPSRNELLNSIREYGMLTDEPTSQDALTQVQRGKLKPLLPVYKHVFQGEKGPDPVAVLPGSSLKGALETLWLDFLLSRQKTQGTKNYRIYQQPRGPFRFLHVPDMRAVDSQGVPPPIMMMSRAQYHVTRGRTQSTTLPYIETLPGEWFYTMRGKERSVFFSGYLDLVHYSPPSPPPTSSEDRTPSPAIISFDEFFPSINDWLSALRSSMEKRLEAEKQIWEKIARHAPEALPILDLYDELRTRNKEKEKESQSVLLRIGHHSQKQYTTIEGEALSSVPQAKTRTVAVWQENEDHTFLIPLGWCLLTIERAERLTPIS